MRKSHFNFGGKFEFRSELSYYSCTQIYFLVLQMFKISDIHPSESNVDRSNVIRNHLLGISFANSKEDLFNCNVAGFVCVTSVDTKSKIVTILSPQPELPADCLFVVSDIQYNYQKSSHSMDGYWP